MSLATGQLLQFDNTYVRELEGLYLPFTAAGAPAPRLLALNEELARELGVDPEALRAPEGVAVLAGNAVPPGAEPIAQAYSGHQFGGFSPRLGDGRALLLGEVLDTRGQRRDLHFKGSGRTPFSRGADGKAAVGPMLREYLIGEAMHGLGIPTTRALAVVATGEQVLRESGPLPGALVVRVAASHLRVGTFQYAALQGDVALLRRLADYAIARHHPAVAEADEPYLALLAAVADVQARLVAQWMSVGFIHGVMNTDNMTISGETIDYGPCAFMDAYDPATVYSSIDHGGRYAYGNQPPVAQWNLARFAEALLPLIDPVQETAIEKATATLQQFPERYSTYGSRAMIAKLGLTRDADEHTALVEQLLGIMRAQHVDFAEAHRGLSSVLRGDARPVRDLFLERDAFDAWAVRWQAALDAEGRDRAEVADGMDRINPVYVPRNHLVEEALAAATDGDLAPFERLVEVVSAPFDERPGRERYAQPAPEDFAATYRTFCGT